MSKKKKIIVIAVAVTLALVMGVGGLAYAVIMPHMELGGHKLIGVGEMGGSYYDTEWYQHQEWDTQFIITNPNCDRDLTIEWVALIAGEDIYPPAPFPEWYAEEVIFEGTPDDWYAVRDIEIPGNENSEIGVLSPHEVWQVSITELMYDADPYGYGRGKYTLEVTWSGVPYTLWFGWRGRPLIGWQKEKCWSVFEWWEDLPSFAISEAEMQVFPSRVPFRLPED